MRVPVRNSPRALFLTEKSTRRLTAAHRLKVVGVTAASGVLERLALARRRVKVEACRRR